jgi:membrane dipeptidase
MSKSRGFGLVALLAVLPLALLASGDPVSPASKFHFQSIVVDTHIDTPQRLLDEGFDLDHRDPYGHIDIPRMKEGGLDAAFFSIWVDPEKYQADPSHRALELISTVYEQVERHPDQLLLARTADDIRRAQREGKVALLMGMEGGYPIENSLRLLHVYARLGVRYMTLTHGVHTDWADSSGSMTAWLQGGPQPAHNGLTDFGRQVVQEMNRLGMMVDISHVSEKTLLDALAAAKAPVIASHSSCRSLVNHPRNLTDDQISAIARNGGVVQVAFGCFFVQPDYMDWYLSVRGDWRARTKAIRAAHADDPRKAAVEVFKLDAQVAKKAPRGSLKHVVDHIDHVVQIAGVDHVGLGSDFDGVSCLPEGMKDASFLPKLTQALLARGYAEADVKKILGGNMLRVMEETERVARDLSAAPKP